jgi:hypothetical protein
MTYLPAAIAALRFHNASSDELAKIPGRAWPELLEELDTAQLTLALGVQCCESIPHAARARIDRDIEKNAIRYDRLLAACRTIDAALRARGINYVVLKGISQSPEFTDNLRHRPQYDVDIYVPDESMAQACAAMREIGYQPSGVTEDPGADHIPVLIRKTGWKWRGDYFDPEMPPSLELHFRFWNSAGLGFDAPGVKEFWRRRTVCRVEDFEFPVLDRADALTYAAVHLLRHLLGGDLKARHVYEIAYALERSSRDEEFWSRWRESALPSCRTIEAIAFRLARDWFHCRLHPIAADAVKELPAAIQRWFALFGAASPSGKNELWLHLCLVDGQKARWQIARRRLLPVRRSRLVRNPHVAKAGRHLAWRVSFLAKRAVHHVRALAPTIHGAWVWYTGRSAGQDGFFRPGTLTQANRPPRSTNTDQADFQSAAD